MLYLTAVKQFLGVEEEDEGEETERGKKRER